MLPIDNELLNFKYGNKKKLNRDVQVIYNLKKEKVTISLLEK